MTINEKSINRLGGGTEEAEAEKGEEDHVLEIEDEVVLEVVATMITDEAGENKQNSAIETPFYISLKANVTVSFLFPHKI